METYTSTTANNIWGLADLRLSCHLDGPLPQSYQNGAANRFVCEGEAEEMHWVI